MRRAALVLALLIGAAGCGEGGLMSREGRIDAEGLNTIAVAPPEPEPVDRSTLLEPLADADLEREGLDGAGCDFSDASGMLLAAVSDGAAARIEGRIVRLAAAGPVGDTGGFFEAPEVAISVGRLTGESVTGEETVSWSALLSVTNRRTGAQRELPGTWTCGA